jgi:hypothetical protein
MRAAAFNDAMAAARNGSVRLVQEWLETGHIDEIEQGDRCQGRTLLHAAAAAADQKAVVKFLLSRAPSVNAITSHGQTALHLAALDSHEDVCSMLLDHSCNPLLRTSLKRGSRTARDTALLFGHRSLAPLLEEAEQWFSCSSSRGGGGNSRSTSAASRSSTKSLNRLADFSKWAKTDWVALERDADAGLAVPLARLPPAPSQPPQQPAAIETPMSPPTHSSDPDRLLSFRLPPEGCCKPNSSDGGCGPPLPLMRGGGEGGVCYTWGRHSTAQLYLSKLDNPHGRRTLESTSRAVLSTSACRPICRARARGAARSVCGLGRQLHMEPAWLTCSRNIPCKASTIVLALRCSRPPRDRLHVVPRARRSVTH